MSIAIKCSGCGKTYSLKEDLAGKRVKCKCGQAMKVPELPRKPADADESDPTGALLDDALPATEAAKPRGLRRAPAVKPAAKSDPVKTKKKAKKKNDDLSPAAVALIGVGVVGFLLVGAAVVTFFVIRAYRPGSASPEEAFAAHQVAVSRDDCRMLMRTFSLEAHAVLADSMLAFAWESRDGGSLAESSKFVKEVLQKHGVAGMSRGNGGSAGESDKAPADDQEETSEEASEEEVVVPDREALAKEAAERRKKAVSAIEDKATFCKEYWLAIKDERNTTLPRDPVKQALARQPEEQRREYLDMGTLSNVKIDGDTASGEVSYRLAGEPDPFVTPMAFKKSDGRWVMHFNSVEELESSPWRDLFNGRLKLNFNHPVIDMIQGP